MQVSATCKQLPPLGAAACVKWSRALFMPGVVLQQASADGSFSLLHALPSTGTGRDIQRRTAGCPMHGVGWPVKHQKAAVPLEQALHQASSSPHLYGRH